MAFASYIVDPERLAPEVQHRNEVNHWANALRVTIKEVLEPYGGDKVIKFTPYKGWIKKLADQLKGICLPKNYTLVYNFSSDKTVYAELKTHYRAPCGDWVNYVSQEFYICSIVDSTHLEEVFRPCKLFRTDYTVDEIVSAREEIRSLESRVSQLKSQISEFR
jgi:hypothetical protein